MVLRSISNRGVVLRDTGGGQYNVPAYGELEVLDSLLNDSVFLKWLRFRVRDLIVITAKIPEVVDTTDFATLSATAFHRDEVYLEIEEGVRWHLAYNANSTSTYKWEFLGGTPKRVEVLTAQAIASEGTWSNLTTDGPLYAAPRAGDYNVRYSANVEFTANVTNAQVGAAVGNADPDPPFPIAEEAAGLQALSGSQRLTGVAASAALKLRYYSDTAGELPTFSDRVIEITPGRIS